MGKIKCKCGKTFLGQGDKEDTCPDCLKKLINPEMDEDEMFSILERFTQKLRPDEFAIINNGNIRLNNEGDELLILDKAKGRIAKELVKED